MAVVLIVHHSYSYYSVKRKRLALTNSFLYNKSMDKKIQSAKKFVTERKNRTTVIAATAGIVAIVAGIVTYAAKRGGKRN